MNKTYEPQSFEEKIYQTWLDKKYFSANPNSDKKKYSICMPPPNVTGVAHAGHAYNGTMQDILIRTKRMQGFEVFWLPGTDHAAIATEEKVVKKITAEGHTKESLGREKFMEYVWDWYNFYGDTICKQLMKVGLSCDWDKKAFTMDENLCRAVRKSFVEYYKQGLIYKGKRVVNYCPKCKTSISDIENVYHEQDTKLWHIRYPLEKGEGGIVVATTRPETLFGDTAIAVNPKDKRYKDLIGKNVVVPIVNRPIPVIGDDYCEMEFGTGAVKITPAHDVNDYEVGLRHNLDIITVLDDSGKLNEIAGEFFGMDRIEARKPIEEKLKALGVLVKVEDYKNKVGCCERCHTITEPKISDQWWVKMTELAKPAIEAVKSGELRFHPKRTEKIYLNWLENIHDWCISRQLWTGHRIPVFTCEDCGFVDACEEDMTVCPKCASKNISQDPDVLDTWFSSALWPFSAMGWPNDTDLLKAFYPTSAIVTGWDIIPSWIVRMVFSGLHFTGKLPFKDVVINGMVKDSQGRKMSKNLGNGINPIDVCRDYGADSLRLSLISGTTVGSDCHYGLDMAKEAKIFINKLYNACKFVLANVENDAEIKFDGDLADLSEFGKDFSSADKWLLSKLQELISTTTKNIESFAFNVAATNLMDFTISVFCDWYIEASKVDLYGEDEEKKIKTKAILLYSLTTLLKLFHPIIPFVTEEIYQNLPHHDETIMFAKFPIANKKLLSKDLDFEMVISVVKAIRGARVEYNIPDNKKISINILPLERKTLLSTNLGVIAKLAMGSEIDLISKEPVEKSAKITTSICEIYLPMGDLVDEAQEKERLNKQIEELKFEIERSEKMLNNVGFVSKAPKEMVEKEREKLAKNKEFLANLLKN